MPKRLSNRILVYLLCKLVGEKTEESIIMKYQVKLKLGDIEFKIEISALSKKDALKSMLQTARSYPEKRMTIVSINKV